MKAASVPGRIVIFYENQEVINISSGSDATLAGLGARFHCRRCRQPTASVIFPASRFGEFPNKSIISPRSYCA